MSVRAGGTWARADSLDELPGVGFQDGFLWVGTEGVRLDPLEWPDVAVDGVEMRAMAPHGVLWGQGSWPSGGDTALPVVIWLARDGGGQDDHAAEADALAAQGFFVLRYDRRGLGNSRLWETEPVTLESHARDIDDWLPFLDQHPMADITDLGLFGHGLGGRVAALRSEPSVTVSGPGDDRVDKPDHDAREAWRAGDACHGLTPSSMRALGEALNTL